MPDWNQSVRKNLRVLGVCSPEFTEELAGHLEESYEDLLREGVPAEVAFRRAMSQIEGRRRNWLTLRFLQEDLMTGFIRKIALPGLLTFAASAFVMYAWMFALAHVHPKMFLLANGQFLALPLWAWCLLWLQPLCGALGALLSQRNGGSRPQRIAAALFPSGIMGTVLLLIFVVAFILSRFVPNYGWDAALAWKGLGLYLLGWVILPAVFLLLGAGVAEVSARKFDRLAQ
jgi:hypothetical protein